jgi:hypothetical protein
MLANKQRKVEEISRLRCQATRRLDQLEKTGVIGIECRNMQLSG